MLLYIYCIVFEYSIVYKFSSYYGKSQKENRVPEYNWMIKQVLFFVYVFHELLKSFHELLDAPAIDDDIPRNLDFVGTDPTDARIPFGPHLNSVS